MATAESSLTIRPYSCGPERIIFDGETPVALVTGDDPHLPVGPELSPDDLRAVIDFWGTPKGKTAQWAYQRSNEPKSKTREQWLEDRRSGIGASEAAAALGVNPYRAPIELWAEKCGLVDSADLSGNEAVEFGVRLEPVIAQAYAERTGRQVTLWDQTRSVRHPEIPFLFCTPDAMQTTPDDSGTSNVQIKTAGAFFADEWREGPPLHYEVQVQAEMFCLGFERATLVVLIGGQKLRYFDLRRNDRFIAALTGKLEEFWRCVETRTPPAVDHSQACAKALLRLHPLDNGESVALPAEAIEWDAELQGAKQRLKELEEYIAERENRLKSAIADCTFGVLPDGTRYSWKHQHRDSYVAKESDFRVLRKLKK